MFWYKWHEIWPHRVIVRLVKMCKVSQLLLTSVQDCVKYVSRNNHKDKFILKNQVFWQVALCRWVSWEPRIPQMCFYLYGTRNANTANNGVILDFKLSPCTSSSSSIGTATLVGFGLLNYRWVFSAERFLQSVVASDTSNPQPGGPVI